MPILISEYYFCNVFRDLHAHVLHTFAPLKAQNVGENASTILQMLQKCRKCLHVLPNVLFLAPMLMQKFVSAGRSAENENEETV